ncbi:hypothetical protein [Streptomyces avermitilis]|uniref:hypothetical protein n=1 Tax=Streptomyces avermitilis TaxID=33903 RepID=UPI00381DA1D5
MRNRLVHVLTAAMLGLTALTAPAVASPTAYATPRPSVAPLLSITSASLQASQAGNNWTLVITATERFSTLEIERGYTVADNAHIYERDHTELFGGSEDHLLQHGEETFTVTRPQENFTWTFHATSAKLDTESGSEQIYGWVTLRNVTTGAFRIAIKTPIIHIDP